ncbi:D-lactate dehydrogenase-like protein [Trypanosoma grayi]|uniref:D-lactate dehydrogenase-like protein n=1 Tax=Trypanosoma grayi TaxID=71804 RepID=UPI0004F4055B|nr:D-lactate dehydrogenase-like protein [Trypanosoma grayi]KEG09940.1 D-lactate dehydrogenase-like protein [Trypanosoma grayi]
MPAEYNIAPLAERQEKYAALFAALRAVLPDPDKQLILDPKKLESSYSSDKSYHMPVTPCAAVVPATIEQVAAVVKLCAAHRAPMTPRGAGTGIEGGAIPYGGGVVIDTNGLQRMDFDVNNAFVWVGAGVKKLQLVKAARERGFTFGPDPSSNPCVGGMVSTSGSGMSTLKYGTTRENILSLRVVTPMGSVVETRKVVRKSSSGLDLTQLYCGSEGTLGIVCEVAFKLWPLQRHSAGGFARFATLPDDVRSIAALRRAGFPRTPTRCELISADGIRASNKYLKEDLVPAPTILMEFTDNDAKGRQMR